MDVVIALRGSETHGGDAGQIAWYENDGDPAAGPWRKHVIDEPFPKAFEAVAADVDGDGQMEVVATRWGDYGGLAIYKHDGDPRGPLAQADDQGRLVERDTGHLRGHRRRRPPGHRRHIGAGRQRGTLVAKRGAGGLTGPPDKQ